MSPDQPGRIRQSKTRSQSAFARRSHISGTCSSELRFTPVSQLMRSTMGRLAVRRSKISPYVGRSVTEAVKLCANNAFRKSRSVFNRRRFVRENSRHSTWTERTRSKVLCPSAISRGPSVSINASVVGRRFRSAKNLGIEARSSPTGSCNRARTMTRLPRTDSRIRTKAYPASVLDSSAIRSRLLASRTA